jgi:hypothetical protein
MLLRVPTKHCLPIIEDPLDHTLLSWSKARRQCGTGALPNSHASDVWCENKMEMPQHQHSEKCKAVDSSSDKLESKRKAAPAMLPPPH